MMILSSEGWLFAYWEGRPTGSITLWLKSTDFGAKKPEFTSCLCSLLGDLSKPQLLHLSTGYTNSTNNTFSSELNDSN